MEYRRKNPVVNAVRVFGSEACHSGLFSCEGIPSWLADRIAKNVVRVKRRWTDRLKVQILNDDNCWHTVKSGDWIVEDNHELVCVGNDTFNEMYDEIK